MKPVLIQNLIKKQRGQPVKIDPTDDEVQKIGDKFFVAILLLLALIIVGSISIGA